MEHMELEEATQLLDVLLIATIYYLKKIVKLLEDFKHEKTYNSTDEKKP